MKYVVNLSSSIIGHYIGEPGELYPNHSRPVTTMDLGLVLGDPGQSIVFSSLNKDVHDEVIELDPDYHFIDSVGTGHLTFIVINKAARDYLWELGDFLLYRVFEGHCELD